jgi:uncharacterized OB-fold protein
MESGKSKEDHEPGEGLYKGTGSESRLIVGHCTSCGRYFFPKAYPLHKPGCHQEQVEEVLLGPRGVLRSFTWQHYMPPPPYSGPKPFVPYGIGMVEFEGKLNVVGILTDCRMEDMQLGIPVELMVEALNPSTPDQENVTWKFKPVK